MLKSFSAILLGLAFTAAAHAQPDAAWQAGKHYTVIEPPQATTTGNKVEVVEVFSYACPHCNEIAPLVESMKNALPANAEFVLLPAQFGFDAWKVYARAFYTAQALGIADNTHADVFRAIYVDKKLDARAPTMESVAAFYARHGVSAEDFLVTSKSFAIETRLKRNDAVIKAYGVDGTPAFIVNGKYRLSGQSAGGYDKVEPLIRHLIARESGG